MKRRAAAFQPQERIVVVKILHNKCLDFKRAFGSLLTGGEVFIKFLQILFFDPDIAADSDRFETPFFNVTPDS